MATRTGTPSPALHVGDRHELIRVQGARQNNLKDVSVELLKRRLSVFTGVSGSGKSSLVFGTIAAVDRAVTFTACPDCGGTRLSEAARSSRIGGINIADACAMQISDLAEWVRGLDEPSLAPLLATLQADPRLVRGDRAGLVSLVPRGDADLASRMSPRPWRSVSRSAGASASEIGARKPPGRQVAATSVFWPHADECPP